MLGDICTTCNCPHGTGTCDACKSCCDEAQPNLPCTDDECKTWVPMHCVFWMGDAIPGTPIVKGTRLTEVVTHLISRIVALEA